MPIGRAQDPPLELRLGAAPVQFFNAADKFLHRPLERRRAGGTAKVGFQAAPLQDHTRRALFDQEIRQRIQIGGADLN